MDHSSPSSRSGIAAAIGIARSSGAPDQSTRRRDLGSTSRARRSLPGADRFLLVSWRGRRARLRRPPPRGAKRPHRRGCCCSASRCVLGALLASGSIADVSGLVARPDVGVAAASLGFLAARSLFGRVRARLDQRGRAADLRRRRRAARGRLVVLFPPLAVLIVAASCGCFGGRRRRARSTRACGSCDSDGQEFVLAVIDAMKPAMLERAVATGRAPTLELLIERGQSSTSASPRSRRSRRSARPRSRPAPGPPSTRSRR